jgi:hypothetical protein
MPFLLEKLLLFKNNDLNTAQLNRTYVAASSEPDRFEPKFTLAFSSIHMDVRWFNAFIRIKMETPI